VSLPSFFLPPIPFPPLPSIFLPSSPLPSPTLPLPLEVGPYIAAKWSGGALKLPQRGPVRSPGGKSNFGIFGAQVKASGGKDLGSSCFSSFE